jgi:hypothetical protein
MSTTSPAVVEAQIDEIIEYALGFVGEDRIDWEDLLFRIELAFDFDLPTQFDDPMIKFLKAKILKARREARE